jgi:hypothetical protein
MKRLLVMFVAIGVISSVRAQDTAGAQKLNIELTATLEAAGRYVSLQGRSLFITVDLKTNAPASGYWLTLDPDPAAPRVRSQTVPGAWDMAVARTHALVCDDTPFLSVYAMTETNWTSVAKLKMPSMTENIVLRSNRAYVANHTAGLTIADISDPAKPGIIANLNPKIDCDGIALWKQCAILYGHWESRLVLVDVSDPAQPRELGIYQHEPKTFIQGEVAANDGIACAVAGKHGLVIVNIADPANPKLAKVVDLKGAVTDVALMDGLAFAAAGQGGVHVLDLKNPAQPVEVGLYRDAAKLGATELAVMRNQRGTLTEYFIYVANAKGPALALRFRPASRNGG